MVSRDVFLTSVKENTASNILPFLEVVCLDNRVGSPGTAELPGVNQREQRDETRVLLFCTHEFPLT